MRVDMVAYTVVNEDAIAEALGGFRREHWSTKDPDHLVETAGRLCYLSFDRPNPKTRKNEDYTANVIGQGHESVLAHPSVTFLIQGVSRALTHEMIRSRFLAFSELSQRYVDVGNTLWINPPAFRGIGDLNTGDLKELVNEAYGDLVRLLIDMGLTRKEAREAARAVMPNAVETKMMVSGNLRAWRDFVKQRLSPTADAEIQELAYRILKYLSDYSPNSVQDLTPRLAEYEARTK